MDNVWTNLGNRLETAWKRPTRPNSKRPKDGEIIDEEKSVRWNREEAVRRLVDGFFFLTFFAISR